MNKIKGRRAELNYTQQEMADNLGVHVNTYRKYEEGKKYPNLDVAEKLARTLNIPLDKLTTWMAELKIDRINK